MIIGDDGLESEAVGEEAELLERFDGLEFGRLELSVASERRAVVTIDADVHPVITMLHPFGRVDAAEVRDRATGEVDRFAILGADDLDHARGEEAFGRMDFRDCGDQRALGLLLARDEPIEKVRLDERFVALDVKEKLAR